MKNRAKIRKKMHIRKQKQFFYKKKSLSAMPVVPFGGIFAAGSFVNLPLFLRSTAFPSVN